MTTRSNLLIREDFDAPFGQFPNYTVYDINQFNQLTKQRHLDLRSFQQDNILIQVSMIHMDLATMGTLNQYQMLGSGDNAEHSLEGNVIVSVGEQWTAGVVGKNSDRNNLLGLSLSCTVAGPNQTQSIIKEQ